MTYVGSCLRTEMCTEINYIEYARNRLRLFLWFVSILFNVCKVWEACQEGDLQSVNDLLNSPEHRRNVDSWFHPDVSYYNSSLLVPHATLDVLIYHDNTHPHSSSRMPYTLQLFMDMKK